MQPELVDVRTGQTRAVCVDCGEPFAHSLQEIAARRGSGLSVSPRCPDCRVARRNERNARVLESLRSGDLRASRLPSPGPINGAERLYPAICFGCQRPIHLPFKPRLDRPVYCRFCFETRNGR